MWEKPPDSPAAMLDEIEHRRFLQQCAEQLIVNEAPKQAAAPPPKYVTQAELQRALSKLSESIGKAVARMVVKPLQARIAELEQKQLTLGGVWREGQQYGERTLVQKDGGLWLSMAPTSAKPGNGSPSWRLVVKKGAAG